MKSLGSIRTNHKKSNLAIVRDPDGKLDIARQGIADIFVDFYEELYATRSAETFEREDSPGGQQVPEINAWEVEGSLQKWPRASHLTNLAS